MLAMEVNLTRFVRRPALSLTTIASMLAPTSEAARDKASWSVKTPHLSAAAVDTTGNIFEAGTNSIASADLVMVVSHHRKFCSLYSYDARDWLTAGAPGSHHGTAFLPEGPSGYRGGTADATHNLASIKPNHWR